MTCGLDRRLAFPQTTLTVVIQIKNMTSQAGDFRLSDVSLRVPEGRYGMLMGKTGSGKTTLLEAIAGLKPTLSGQVWLGGRDVTRLKPAERDIGYVPQDGALFTTMSVHQQLGFALTIRRVGRRQIKRRVEELAELLHIGDLLGRSVKGLSGGERQRVALGRALSFRPATLLLDEPLSALDDDTREQMYVLLKDVQEQTGVTTLHVTHNLEEAARLADYLFRVEGRLVHQRPVPTPAGNGQRAIEAPDEPADIVSGE
jgi:ABC-type sugar transport system ATPase subunit